jgi:hypothetical protein
MREDGTVEVRGPDGGLVALVRPSAPRAIALRKNVLAVLTAGDRIELYDVARSRLLRSLSTPHGIRPAIDLHYGLAVVTSRTRVYGVDTRTGRTVLLAQAPAPVKAQIEAPGVVYQFNRAGHGYLRLIPFAAVRSALG